MEATWYLGRSFGDRSGPCLPVYFPHAELDVTVSMLIWLALKDPERKLINLLVHPLLGQIGLQAEQQAGCPLDSRHFSPVLLFFWAPGDTVTGELKACDLSGDEKDSMGPPLSIHIMVPDCTPGN